MLSHIPTTSRPRGFVQHLKLPHYVDFQSPSYQMLRSHARRGRQGMIANRQQNNRT